MSNLILLGMHDDGITLTTQGFNGQPVAFERASEYKDFYHYLPASVRSVETIRVDEDLSPGEKTPLKMLRGVGQFGIFYNDIDTNESDYRISIYSDPNKTIKIAEFTG